MTVQPDSDRHWTVADYMAMDDDNRYEIIDGELYTVPAPSDAHQRIATRLGSFIDMHVMEHNLGEYRHAPFDVAVEMKSATYPARY